MCITNVSPKLSELIGKIVLIGVTKLSHKEELIEQHQYVGTFMSMDQSIHVRLRSGEDFTLPPDISVFRKAAPGVYRLRSTGEEVEDPDFTASWTVRAPAPKRKASRKKK